MPRVGCLTVKMAHQLERNAQAPIYEYKKLTAKSALLQWKFLSCECVPLIKAIQIGYCWKRKEFQGFKKEKQSLFILKRENDGEMENFHVNS